MKVKSDSLAATLNRRFDVFITACSFEQRCLTVWNQVRDTGFADKITFLNIPYNDVCKEHAGQFDEAGFVTITAQSTRQPDTALAFAERLAEILRRNSAASFLVDITTFTRQTLLIVLRLLRNFLSATNFIQFVYTPAKEYSVGLPESEKWLTQGILQVNSVFGYSGIIRPSNPYHLIILMGYEVERAASLITEYEPSKISVGHAVEYGSISDEHCQLNTHRFEQLVAEFPNAQEFTFSAIDVNSCVQSILQVVNKYPHHNVIVSPMNNKISTLACALAAFEDKTVQLSVAIPALYNCDNYSTPGDECHILNVPEFAKAALDKVS